MMSDMIPSFWIPFGMMLAICVFLAWREDLVHGAHYRGREEDWTPLYLFCLNYAGRLIILAGLCALMQLTAWAMENVL